MTEYKHPDGTTLRVWPTVSDLVALDDGDPDNYDLWYEDGKLVSDMCGYDHASLALPGETEEAHVLRHVAYVDSQVA